MRKYSHSNETINPYIALADVTINVIFILIFMMAALMVANEINRVKTQVIIQENATNKTIYQKAQQIIEENEREKVKYKKAQQTIRVSIQTIKPELRPTELPSTFRNDPPGAQRWVFYKDNKLGALLFKTAQSAVLTPQGEQKFLALAEALRSQFGNYRRIRIEGHSAPSKQGLDNWNLSAQRAATIANLFSTLGQIKSNYLAVSARGSQTPFSGIKEKRSEADNRVEIVVEYNQKL